MADEKEYRLVKKYGETFVEVRYKGSEWTGWLFKASKVAKKYYRYVPELDIYMCNVSYG